MKIKISQKTADKLMALYREMDLVLPEEFNQEHCDTCIIGHGMRGGVIKGFFGEKDFEKAVAWVGLPEVDTDIDDECEFGVLGDYLFGTPIGVSEAAFALDLPDVSESPKDAKMRIAAVLKRSGYELVWNN